MNLTEAIRRIITLLENLDEFPSPPQRSLLQERDLDLQWFKEQYAHVKSYHFVSSQSRMYAINAIDSVADLILSALGAQKPKNPGMLPAEPLNRLLKALNLTQDQDHSGTVGGLGYGHSEHWHSWQHLENPEAGFGVFYMSRGGRVFEPDTWIIGAHDAKTLDLITSMFRDAGIFPDSADITMRKREAKAKRLEKLPKMGIEPGMIHSDNGVEFEILGTTPTGMVKVKFLNNNHYKYPEGTVLNLRPTQIKRNKLRKPGGIPPETQERLRKIQALNLKPGTKIYVKDALANIQSSGPVYYVWKISSIDDNGMLKATLLNQYVTWDNRVLKTISRNHNQMGLWPSKSKQGGFAMTSQDKLLDPSLVTRDMRAPNP